MNYELAKKLKEAGFPQSGQWGDITDVNNRVVGFVNKTATHVVPTLSELIESCGTNFDTLTLSTKQTGYAQVSDWWYATAKCDKDAIPPMAEGETPEEAVANLWLALQHK